MKINYRTADYVVRGVIRFWAAFAAITMALATPWGVPIGLIFWLYVRHMLRWADE